MRNNLKLFLTIIFFALPGFFIQIAGQNFPKADNLYIPDGDNQPEWVKVENLRFSRLDGGYIEVQKAKRTKWGQGWTDEEYEALQNIYLKHSDNIINKMKQGGINVIWVTWSNGWSLSHESRQRDDLKKFIIKCHQNDIKVIAYICASTIFWENMFIDHPISFDIARKQSTGIPYTYLGENPLRFLANLDHPKWIKLQKKRVELALKAGIDGFFFDNPLSADQPIENQVHFMNEIQKYIKTEKNRPDVLITSNFGLQPQLQNMNRQLDFVFNEFGRQPGVYNGIWVMGNIKKIKYIRSFLPSWKTTMHEANYFPGGLRERVFMPPKAQKLARAEAAMFGATYVNFIEGRLLADLLHDRKEAVDSWKAVGLYNKFLSKFSEYYADALQLRNILVILPNDAKFTFDRMEDASAMLLDYLSQNNVLYDVQIAGNLQSEHLKNVDLLIVPNFLQIDRSITMLIESFKAVGGKVMGIGGNQFIKDISDIYYPWQMVSQLKGGFESKNDFLKTINSLSRNYSLEIRNAPNTLGNVTSQMEEGRVVIHLINYNDRPIENVFVSVNLKGNKKELSKGSIQAFSPDFKKDIISEIKVDGSTLEFQVPKLDTYSIIVVN